MQGSGPIVFRRRLGACVLGAALFLHGARNGAAAFERPSPQAACAAYDLHLIDLIEKAGQPRGMIRTETLVAAAHGLELARRHCAQGKVAEGILIYEAFAFELSPADAAEERHFASLCGRELRC